MMAIKIVSTAISVMALTSTLAMAVDGTDENSRERISTTLQDYGFTHVTELEWKSNERIEVEGFTDEQRVDVTMTTDGEVSEEEREQVTVEPWGLTLAQLANAMQQGVDSGMTRFEEIDVSQRGVVEVEGNNEDGRDTEININLSDLR